MTTTDLSTIKVASEEELKQMTAMDVKAQIEAVVKSALDEARMRRAARPAAEIAEPEGWWNLYAYGPLQDPIGIPAPLLPHQVIKVGEYAYVVTVLLLNDFLILSPGTTAADVLSNFALPFEVRYQTGNLTTWTLGQADMNVVHSGAGFNLVPQTNDYYDVLVIEAREPGLYEMNISARILGATSPFANSPQFAGYARAVFDFDPDLFISDAPGWQFDLPIRFQIYE
jgi:hypothetical protein